MSKRAVIYARVSTDLQRENFSIPSQIAECTRYSKKQGYTVVGDQFIDPGNGLDAIAGNGAVPAYVDDYSSRELSRPSLDAAFRYSETTGFDVLVVHSLDRLARDPYIRQTLEREFQARGAKVEFVLGNYDETPEGEVRKDLEATFAKWENTKRVERSNRGKRRKAESGFFVTGKPPYGYKWDEHAQAYLGIDEEQAPIIQWIFDMYVNEGKSVREIISNLEAEGILSHEGKYRWAPTSVRRILQNTAYIGKIYYNKTKLLVNKKREDRDFIDWIEIPTTPIVENWIFEEAQKRFNQNRMRKRRQPKRFYLLTGLVICDECNKPYMGQTYNKGKQRRRTEKQIYRHRVDRGHCTNKSIRAELLEEVVWEEIVSVLKDPYRLRRGYEESLELHKAKHERHQAHIETLKKKAEKLELAKGNLVAAYIDPEVPLPRDVYIDQMEKIERELKTIVKDLEYMHSELKSIPTPDELECLEAFSVKIFEKLDTMDPTPEERRRILDLLHISVIIGLDGRVRLEGWFSNQGEEDGLLIHPS